MFQKKNKNIWFYGLLGANVLPVLAALAGIWEFRDAMYVYWSECALVAAFALAMYAKYLIVFFVMTGSMGLIVYLANPELITISKPLIIYWCLYSLCWLGYIEIGKSNFGKKVRKINPIEQLVAYGAFMAMSMGFCFLVTKGVTAWDTTADASSYTFFQTLAAVSIIVPTISVGLVRVIDMIGPKHFVDFVLGTYHKPQERNSIVLFLDMVGSSTMAEKLEAKQSMDLVARFISDCGFIFRVNGGDILNYTGDGLVVLWPRDKANSALSAVHALRAHFKAKKTKAEYWKRYGLTPDFRIGIHAGTVVISQIGEEKLFLGLYGDVVNTAARLEQMNKALDTHILLSAEVVQSLNQSWKALLKPMGEQEVRGRDEKVKVFTLYDS